MNSNRLIASAGTAALGGLCLTMAAGQASAAPPSNIPLFLHSGVAPNVILTLDDSASMTRDYIPDTINENRDYNELYFYSAHYNGMAYDPNVTYVPPVHADGSSFSTQFTAAWDDGFKQAAKDDLRDEYLAFDVDETGNWEGSGDGQDENQAFYAVWDPDNTSCNGSDTDNDCYDKVIVSSTSGPGNTDERQNFANWYSFYRTRRSATITAATLAFQNLGAGIRLGWQRLNSDATIEGVQEFSGIHRQKFYTWVLSSPAVGSTSLREALQRAGEYYKRDAPYRKDPTNKRSELVACRQNYLILMTDGLWNGNLDPNVGNEDNNTHILPDGETYEPQPPFSDTSSNTLADLAFHYWRTDLKPELNNIVPAFMPYKGRTPADSYWNPRNNPATWQHMVTFTVSLGLDTALTDPDWGGSVFAGDYPAIASGEKNWPEVGKNDPDNAYDLWHAAINGRGGFFSTDSPHNLAHAFRAILDRVQDDIASAAPAALQSSALSGGDAVYIVRFNSQDWTGQLVSYALLEDGGIGKAQWDAACMLDGGFCATDGNTYTGETGSTRRIVTWSPKSNKGVPFGWGQLTATQQDALDGRNDNTTLGKNRLKYLRGDDSKEQINGGSFRNRDSLLGDIVNSSPVYVGAPTRFYPSDWNDRLTPSNDITPEDRATKTYGEFKSAYSSRAGVVYVGANDGMLHAFAADDGEELFAYVPNAVFDNLAKLSKPEYTHRFYVDGTPTSTAAYFNEGPEQGWHTVLVGGLRAGGQAIYALDITNVPDASATEQDIADKVLWEFTDADLGYTYSQPQVARLHNGDWAVIFGNGYNSTENDGSSGDGDAVLYLVDVEDGSLIAKIDTGIGSTSNPNGLATVTTADIDGDLIVDYVYAGDLYGNLWKFDLTSSKPKQWKVAYNNPIFQALGPHGTLQPITTKPSIRRHPTGEGYLLIFGTGKYLNTADTKIKTTDKGKIIVQSVYGIWDRDQNTLTSITRKQLLEQTIQREITKNGSQWRVVSNNIMQWYTGDGVPDNSDGKTSNDGYLGWYLDLKVKGKPAAGEMQVTNTLIRSGRLIFTTLIPNDNPCGMGGTNWLMVLDYKDGSRFQDMAVFDVNNDGVFSLKDYYDSARRDPKVSLSGTNRGTGILQEPILASGEGMDIAYLGSGTDGGVNGGTDCQGKDCVAINRKPGLWNRQSWRQLR